MKGKQYILVQGYNGCQFCNKIGANLAKIRKALNAAGKQDIPIVVINVRPEKDKDNLAAYAKEYVDAEICTANSFGKNLIIAFPRNWNAAHDLQDAIGASYLRQDAWPKDDKILHGMRIAVVDSDGVCKAAALGTVEDNVKSQKLVNTVLNVLGNGRSRQ